METLPEQNLNTGNIKESLPQKDSSVMPDISKKKSIFLILSLALILLILGVGFFYFLKHGGLKQDTDTSLQTIQEKPKGIMILIEYKDTIGLVNFVNELQKRKIPGLLHVSPEFVEANCDTIKELLKYDMEIMASLGGDPFWGISYEDQKREILNMKNTIEACTNTPVKIISSSFMASDMTTIQVAEELGIPYVTARGTTDSKATVYEIEGYKTKILSVSNIPKVQFKYGSLCDYSYYERSGTPDDMLQELTRAIEPLTQKEKERYGSNHKVTPVTHTNIGGYLKPWTDMWINFWDTTKDEIEWVTLDEFMAVADWKLPDWQIPINKNAPYTPEKIRPLTPYEEVEKVQNPCKVEDLGGIFSLPENKLINSEGKMVVFHNGQGPMCLDFLEFIKTINYEVEQHLTIDEDFYSQFETFKSKYTKSEGVSENFEYYPIIFIGDKVFSGFDDSIKQNILSIISVKN